MGPNPTDRGKPGVKKSLLVEGGGGPLGVAIRAANTHDAKLWAATLNAVVVERRVPTAELPQPLCLDKAFDNPSGEQAAREADYIPHIPRIGQEKFDENKEKKHPGRRWVVERTLCWLSKCRAILIRYDKKAENYLALLKLACALLWFRRWDRLQKEAD